MKLNLGANIQNYRKKKGITQEQLAEAMGVTVGAVSKWENGLSNPDLSIIVELADFFEISVDVLLGFQLTAGSMKKAAEYIKKLDDEKQYEQAHMESLKALQKYPNSFEVVYASGNMEYSRGFEQKNQDALRTSIRLLEQAVLLIDQNDDERISRIDILIQIARIYQSLGQNEEALTRLKKLNPNGINDASIGNIYAGMEQYEDAISYLSRAFENAIIQLVNICISFCNCYSSTKRTKTSIETATWLREALLPLMPEGRGAYINKFISYTDICMVVAYLKEEKDEEAMTYMRSAVQYANAFVEGRNYTMEFPFTKNTGHVLCDDTGSGEEFFENVKEQCKDEPELYEKICAIYQMVKEEADK